MKLPLAPEGAPAKAARCLTKDRRQSACCPPSGRCSPFFLRLQAAERAALPWNGPGAGLTPVGKDRLIHAARRATLLGSWFIIFLESIVCCAVACLYGHGCRLPAAPILVLRIRRAVSSGIARYRSAPRAPPAPVSRSRSPRPPCRPPPDRDR